MNEKNNNPNALNCQKGLLT